MYYKDIYVIQYTIWYNVLCLKDIFLKDITMVYKVYATHICCIILYTKWIHSTSWRTYTWPHRNQLLLSTYCLRSCINCSMVPPGLDPVEGSRRLALFLVWPDFLEPSAIAGHVAVVHLGWYVWMYECLRTMMCLLFWLYHVVPPFLFLSHFEYPETSWGSHQIQDLRYWRSFLIFLLVFQ